MNMHLHSSVLGSGLLHLKIIKTSNLENDTNIAKYKRKLVKNNLNYSIKNIFLSPKNYLIIY
jgi:hypothetical protein